MANPGDFAYTLKQQADIVRIVGDYVKLKKAGAQNFSGLCPFHNEKTPSFSVHQTRQFYHCFGCGVSGDVYSFVQKIENITFPEAVRLVAQKLGVPPPKQTYDSPAEAKEAKLRGALVELHEKACVFFEEQLRRPESAQAREYLKNRGLTEEAIKIFRIGYAPDSGFLLRDRLKGQYDEELLKVSGLFSWKQTEESRGPSTRAEALAQDDRGRGSQPATSDQRPATLYSKFRNRAIFPISNESGKIIAFTGRTLATDEKSGPKYLNSPETAIYSKGRVLYNLDRAKEAIRKLDSVILVEGQMDCISVFMAGQHNVIASSGTAFTEAQVRLLGRYTKRIIVNFDPDTAGAAAAERSLAMLVAEDFSIKVATLEPGFDPDLYVRKQGREAYVNLLQRAPKYFDYLMERAMKQFQPRSPEAKVKALNFLLPHIQRVPNRIVRDELANDIAQKLGIDSALLRQDLKHAAATRAASVKAPAEAQLTQAERIIIRALASSTAMSSETPHSDRSGEDGIPDLWRQAEFTLTSEGLHRGLAAESLIEALLKAEAGADPMTLELSESDRRLLAATLMQEAEELTMELVEEALVALRRRRLERQQQEVKHQIAQAERQNDATTLNRLVQEKLRIDRELAARLRQ
ncbi:MAG TPA: DNA primase [Terriglobales bacterium]|nr:DNA primase [Terriglobales bacterium]